MVFHAATWIDELTLFTFGGRDGQSQFFDDAKYRTISYRRVGVRVRVRVRVRAIVDHCAYPLRLPVVLPQPEAVNDNKKGGKSKKYQRGPDLEALVPDEVLLLIFSYLRDDVTSLCQAACACRRYVIKAVVHVQWYQKSC
jgi:hypothetical protein